jgi:anaphase-promoting complex subunit 6
MKVGCGISTSFIVRIDKLNSEWEFIQGLAYPSQTPQDAQFVQLIYTARLRKYKHATEHALTRQRLVEQYGLGDNPDVLFSFADSLYANFQFADCFTITSRSVTRPFDIAFVN